MLSRTRPIVRTADTTDRTSTGIDYPPSIPVDGVELVGANFAGHDVDSPDDPPLELLRQLETCVRELLEVNSKSR